ncbi:hypothetical protein, partial [uncultured Tateyamaria sp.]|uniref:hypothetical protein n=1 Tax=uncultured Tateyamaria sp. TaxID=455651 RepID=UPI0026379FF1
FRLRHSTPPDAICAYSRCPPNQSKTNIRISVHEIANAVGGVDFSATAQKTVEELDKANRLLFQFANWLYLMTRNPQALDWAITAQNAYQVEQAYVQLHEIYVTLQSTTGLATPRYFVVRIPREALTKSVSDETGAIPGTVRFTVNPSLASLSTRTPQRLEFSDPEHVGVEELSLYAPLDNYLSDTSETVGTLSGSAEIVFAPFIETEPGAHHFLWDAWVVPNWNAPITPEISIVGLRPIGPTYYRINEITQGHPVLRSRDANYSSTSFSYDRIRSQHEQAIRFVSSGARGSLIDGTLPGMNYRGILGRGLGNTWELTAPAEWSDIGATAWGFDSIDSIDVVFGYLVSPERTSGQTLSKRDVSKAVSEALSAPTSSETCNDLNDRWLCKLAETARFVQREESKGSKDSDSSGRGDFRESHVFSRSAGARSMRLEVLNEIVGAVPKGFELGRGSVAARGTTPVLSQWFVEGEPSQTSVREVFLDLFCLEGADKECKYRTPLNRFGYRDLTHQIVRDEMLEWTNEIPAPVGPIELIRTWRSVESLFGRLDPNSSADQANGRATLLADLREIEIVLRQVGKQMKLLRERISGPIAVARRMVVEYELARSQIDFMRDLATALSNTADQTGSTEQPNAVTEQLERLQELIRANLSQFSCQHAWFMAMNAHEEMNVSIEDYSALMATTLVDALEPDAAYLVSREDPEALVLEAFPFPECQGIFVDAKRQLEAVVLDNE